MKQKPSEKSLCTSNISELMIGDMIIEVEYGKSNKTLEECMLNILKLKLKHI